jgi:hypothetical protein
MRRVPAVIAIGLTLGLVALATPAQAESYSFTDQRGDDDAGGLDIVSATLKNGPHAFTAKITFARNAASHVIFTMSLRDVTGYDIVLHHKIRDRKDSAYLRKEFEQYVPCAGLTHMWHGATTTLTLRVPASCLNEGSYSDIQSAILTEAPYGDDSDEAPETGYTPWIARD